MKKSIRISTKPEPFCTTPYPLQNVRSSPTRSCQIYIWLSLSSDDPWKQLSNQGDKGFRLSPDVQSLQNELKGTENNSEVDLTSYAESDNDQEKRYYLSLSLHKLKSISIRSNEETLHLERGQRFRTSWLSLLTHLSRSSEKTNKRGPRKWVPRNNVVLPCRYSYQAQQNTSDVLHNANSEKIKLKGRSTFRSGLSLKGNLDSWAKAEYASSEENTQKYKLEVYHMNKSNTFLS